jgi:predicted HTH transcriptional regulator
MAVSFKIPLKVVKVLREVGLGIGNERKELDFEELDFEEMIDVIHSEYQQFYTMAEHMGHNAEDIPEQVVREAVVDLTKACVVLLEEINARLGIE